MVLYKSNGLFLALHYLGVSPEVDSIDGSPSTSLPHLWPLSVSVKLYLPLALTTFHSSGSPTTLLSLPNRFFAQLIPFSSL